VLLSATSVLEKGLVVKAVDIISGLLECFSKVLRIVGHRRAICTLPQFSGVWFIVVGEGNKLRNKKAGQGSVQTAGSWGKAVVVSPDVVRKNIPNL